MNTLLHLDDDETLFDFGLDKQHREPPDASSSAAEEGDFCSSIKQGQQLELSWRPGRSPPVALDEHRLLLLTLLNPVKFGLTDLFFQLEIEKN